VAGKYSEYPDPWTTTTYTMGNVYNAMRNELDPEPFIDFEPEETYIVRPSSPNINEAIAGDRQVELKWEAPTDDGGASIINYSIYRGPQEEYELLLKVIGNFLNYTDTNLTNGQTYYYYVTASNFVGESDPSNRIEATPMTVPTPPQDLHAVAGDGQIDLSWNASEDNGGSEITNYTIYRGSVSGEEYELTTIGNVLKFIDTDVINDEKYFYYITAINSVGESLSSIEVSATPFKLDLPDPDDTEPGPPNLQATQGNGVVTLEWTEPDDDGGSPIIKYNVYKGTASGKETLLITLGNVSSFEDNAVTNNITYYYEVSAVNAVGEGNKSNEVVATPGSKITIPSAPLNLRATAAKGKVVLTWKPPSSNGGSAITGYKIYRGTTPGDTEPLDQIGNLLIYTDDDVEDEKKYYYSVCAINNVGKSPNSDEVSATPKKEDKDAGESEDISSFLSSPMFYGLIILIIIIIVVLAILLTKRKKSGEKPKRDPRADYYFQLGMQQAESPAPPPPSEQPMPPAAPPPPRRLKGRKKRSIPSKKSGKKWKAKKSKKGKAQKKVQDKLKAVTSGLDSKIKDDDEIEWEE
jgi:fibronectin type 3 domain-containing protein